MKCMNEEVLVNEISEETGGTGWMIIVRGSICLVGLSTGPVALEAGSFIGVGAL